MSSEQTSKKGKTNTRFKINHEKIHKAVKTQNLNARCQFKLKYF